MALEMSRTPCPTTLLPLSPNVLYEVCCLTTAIAYLTYHHTTIPPMYVCIGESDGGCVVFLGTCLALSGMGGRGGMLALS